MNKGKRTYLEARVRLILPHILFLIFLLAYFYLSYKMVSPFIDSLPINRIENASAIIMQTTGILIGFTGASLYFFSGKMLEISEKVCEKAMSCVYLFSKCQMGYDFVFVELATARSRIKTKSDEKGLQEIESELKKARQESQHFLSEAEKMSKEIKKIVASEKQAFFLTHHSCIHNSCFISRFCFSLSAFRDFKLLQKFCRLSDAWNWLSCLCLSNAL
jgi:hypothetical protein